MIILTKLLLAHIIGDFLLQPDAWVKAKEEKKLKAWQLYVHALIHGIVIMLLVWDIGFLKWASIVAAIHLVIDGTRVLTQTAKFKRYFFFGDQALHFISIVLVYSLYWSDASPFVLLLSESDWLLITLVVFITYPAAIINRIIITKWTPHTGDSDTASLQNAGKYIGILERLFVFTFVITDNWEAVGFLIAAKSIFRFGDLTTARDRKLTEYILIGTLTSFGIAMFAGVFYLSYVKT
jgi:hypothetical protein